MNWAIDGGMEDAMRSVGVAFCVNERLGNGCATPLAYIGGAPPCNACILHPIEVATVFLESANIVANAEILHSENIDLLPPLSS